MNIFKYWLIDDEKIMPKERKELFLLKLLMFPVYGLKFFTETFF